MEATAPTSERPAAEGATNVLAAKAAAAAAKAAAATPAAAEVDSAPVHTNTAVSPTRVASVADLTSSDAQRHDEPEQWSCQHCSFLNSAEEHERRCSMCGIFRPSQRRSTRVAKSAIAAAAVAASNSNANDFAIFQDRHGDDDDDDDDDIVDTTEATSRQDAVRVGRCMVR